MLRQLKLKAGDAGSQPSYEWHCQYPLQAGSRKLSPGQPPKITSGPVIDG